MNDFDFREQDGRKFPPKQIGYTLKIRLDGPNNVNECFDSSNCRVGMHWGKGVLIGQDLL